MFQIIKYYLLVHLLIITFYNINNFIFLMFNRSQIQNILGTLYTSGSVVFHPFQSRVYTPLANRVKCIDLKNNTTSILPLEANRNIKLITINPQGSILVACDTKNNLIIFNLLAEFVIGRLGFSGDVKAFEFSADGKLFAVGEERGFRVYLSPPFWRSLEPLVLIKKYTNRHSLPLTGLSFSPDSRFLLTHGKQPRVFLNNIVSLGKNWTAPSFEVHKYEIVNAFFENSKMEYLYTVDKGGNLFVWKWVEEMSQNYSNRREMLQRRMEKKRGGKRETVVKKEEYQSQAEDNQSENSEEEEEKVDNQALQIQNRKQYHPFVKQYSQFEKNALNGRFILSTKLIVSQPVSQVTHCKYLPAINLLATTHTNGKFAVWKLEKSQLSEIYSYSAGNHEITSLSISPDGYWIVLGIEELGQLIVWEWRSQTYIINQSGRIIDGICSEISPDHKLVAVGTQHGKVRVWDKTTGFCLATFPEEHQGQVSAVKFSNKTTLFSSSLDGTVQAYDLNKYKRFRAFRPDKKAQLTSLAIDEAGEIVCAGAFDPYQVYCWNIQTARLLQIVTGHTGPITCLTFVGEQLFTGGWDRHLRIHEFFSRKLNTQVLDHGSEITAIAIHPYKTQVSVSTLRGEVYIWKVPDTNEMIGILDCQSHWKKQQDAIPITAIAYSSEGEYLAVGGKHKDLLIFDIKYRTLIRRIPLTNNTAYKGVQEFLNSKMIREGVNLEDVQVYSDDDRLPDEGLPGSKKLDISKQQRQLEVNVYSISISDNNFYVGTSFGVLVFGMSKKFKFSPFQTTSAATPEMMIEALKSKSFTQALSIALRLGIPVAKILRKIPDTVIGKVVDELGQNLRNRLVLELGKNEMEQINLMWLGTLLNYDVVVPKQLLLKFERIKIIDDIVGKVEGIVEAGKLLKYEKEERKMMEVEKEVNQETPSEQVEGQNGKQQTLRRSVQKVKHWKSQ